MVQYLLLFRGLVVACSLCPGGHVTMKKRENGVMTKL